MSEVTEGCRAAWRRWYAPIEELSGSGRVSLSSESLRSERQRAFVAGFEAALAAIEAEAAKVEAKVEQVALDRRADRGTRKAFDEQCYGIRIALRHVRESGGEPT